MYVNFVESCLLVVLVLERLLAPNSFYSLDISIKTIQC